MEARSPWGGVTYVILYHDIAPPSERDAVGFPGGPAGRYKLDPALFAAHLDAIEATGVDVGLVVPSGTPPSAALSFDDAGGSALSAAGLLEEHGWRGHFFVPTAHIGAAGFLGPEALRELVDRGHELGSHSHTHPAYMARLPRARILDEWRRSRAILGELLGREPTTASVPGGSLSRTVVECAAEAGYQILMTSEPTSRVSSDEGLQCVGRFAIWATTPPARAAAYVRGARLPRARLWLAWNGKKLAKRANSGLYERLRSARSR
jgi:peptidoglycan/xylan/chitin deacetylase (PgdA/CDA1 family)